LVSNVWLSHGGSISGHVFRVDRARGAVWFAKYRLPDGRQVQKKVAPAWTRPARPDPGYVNRRGAEAWLADVLAQAHTGATATGARRGADRGRTAGKQLSWIPAGAIIAASGRRGRLADRLSLASATAPHASCCG
jgi:hypothetical protein